MPDVVIVSESGTVTVVADTETVTVVEGSGTVYGVSVVSANGFAGSVAKDTTTPQITLSTSINGLLAGDGTSIFAATAGTGLSYDDITGILTNSEPDQTVTLTDGTDITVTGTYPSFTISYSGAGGAGGAYLPLAGGTMTGAIVFGTGSQYISKGNFDTSRGGSSGISLVCSVGYEFNWQAGWLITTADGTTTPRPLYLDSLAGTTLRAWNSSTSTGTEVDHLGITFSDATVQTTAYTGGAGVSSLTAGTGISLDVTTGDITVTNSEPDQTVVLTDGAGIAVTGTYPSFTIDCDITQYADTDARLALSAGTGISYDNTTGIITNDNPDQTVVLTDGTDITITGTYPSFTIAYSGAVGGVSSLTAGTGISLDVTTGDITVTNSEPDQTVTLTDGTGITVTGTYPSFTIDCDVTQYTDTDARLALSAGTGISYDNTTGIITNDAPDQTVTLTDGAGIAVTGTYPSFTIDCDITQYTDTDARLALSAGTGISYDNTTGIITNDNPDQTVTLTDGTDITITGTYPSFTIAYSGTGGGSGTVTTASVVSANGFAGSVATDTTTPAITITTTVTGILIGDGTAIAAATAGTDYVVPSGSITGNAATVTTNADLTGVITSKGNATSIASQTGTGTKFVMDTSPTLITPVLGTPSSGTLTNCTFPTLNQNTTGNAATVTTNANLTGVITSVGNATSIASQTGTGSKFVVDTSPTLITPTIGAATATSLNKITITAPATGATLTIVNGATLTASATASVSGTNTGDNAANTLYSGLVSNATHTGDATGSTALTVVKINGVLMSGLATGILKNTTTTGVPSIATAGTDYVIPSGSITGSAASLSATLAVASGGTGVTTSTGSGANALATSAALTTPTITGLIETKTAPTISAGVLALNCALGNVFAVSLNAAVTSLTFSNIPASGSAFGLTLILAMTGTAYTITWPASVKWPSGTAPTLTSTNLKSDIIILTTVDGGTTWFAFIGGQNF